MGERTKIRLDIEVDDIAAVGDAMAAALVHLLNDGSGGTLDGSGWFASYSAIMPRSAQDGIQMGFCGCGCGRRTSIANRSSTRDGTIKGQPHRFLKGHSQRVFPQPRTPVEYAIDEGSGCWVWAKYVDPQGYGRVRVNGRLCNAHRVIYERHKGPIPEGLVLDHLCRNRACVNPEHLEPVTLKENILRGEGMGARWARRTAAAAKAAVQ